MTREIKFRAWDGQRMLYKKHEFKMLPESGAAMQDRYGDVRPTSDIVLMQYTGLKDENGREIYEGDICSVHTGHKALGADFGTKLYFVRWRETGACFDLIPVENPEHKVGYTFDNGSVFSVEVIGNIYEKPELMEVPHDTAQ